MYSVYSFFYDSYHSSLTYLEIKTVLTSARQNAPDQQQQFDHPSADAFIRCCTALHHAVTQSIPCLRKVLQQWQEIKRKTLGHCLRPRPRPTSTPHECSEKGRPTSSSSCTRCVAWGKAVEDVYYPQTLTDHIPWDTINPTCLAGSHFMIAKAFLGERPCWKNTKLENLDLTDLLNIMMGFQAFVLGERTYDILKKVRLLSLTCLMDKQCILTFLRPLVPILEFYL